MRYILFLMLSITLLSCKKEGQLPRFGNAGKVLWKFPLHKDGTFHSNSNVRANLVFDNKVLLGTTNGENNRFLTCVDINTGQELWSWNDIFDMSQYSFLILVGPIFLIINWLMSKGLNIIV